MLCEKERAGLSIPLLQVLSPANLVHLHVYSGLTFSKVQTFSNLCRPLRLIPSPTLCLSLQASQHAPSVLQLRFLFQKYNRWYA